MKIKTANEIGGLLIYCMPCTLRVLYEGASGDEARPYILCSGQILQPLKIIVMMSS